MKKVLVLSGGGLLGIISVIALQNFQKTIDKPLHEYFDLIYGCSTGAIIGSMIAAGLSIDKIVEMYLKEGSNIFTKQNSWILPWRFFTRPFYDRNRVLVPMQKCLDEIGIKKYGELKTKFVCNSVSLNSRNNVFFKSTSEKWKDYDITEIVSRSFAATFYFGHVFDKNENVYYGDGGTGLMNFPMIPAFIESFVDGDDVEMFAFGTGYSNSYCSSEEISKWENLGEIWNFYLDGGQTLAREQSRLEQYNAMTWIESTNNKFKFHYYDIEIPEKMNKIDGKEFITDYVEYGDKIKF